MIVYFMDGKKFFYKINCYFLFIRSLPQTSEMKIIIFHVIKILLWYTKSHKPSHHANNKSDHEQIRVINISFLPMTIMSLEYHIKHYTDWVYSYDIKIFSHFRIIIIWCCRCLFIYQYIYNTSLTLATFLTSMN